MDIVLTEMRVRAGIEWLRQKGYPLPRASKILISDATQCPFYLATGKLLWSADRYGIQLSDDEIIALGFDVPIKEEDLLDEKYASRTWKATFQREYDLLQVMWRKLLPA